MAWSSSQRQGFHDIAELCGGAGDTAELLIKRGYSGGPNFDIICGIDLLKPQNKAYFLRYLEECKPRILLISTPCTGMKGVQRSQPCGQSRGLGALPEDLSTSGELGRHRSHGADARWQALLGRAPSELGPLAATNVATHRQRM